MTGLITDVSGGLRPLPAPRGEAALLVIDVQRDFAAPDRLPWLAESDQDRITGAVERVAELVRAARSAGIRVVWVALEQDADEPWESSLWLRGIAREPRETRLAQEPCVAGTSGAEWFGVAPAPGEDVVVKRRYSAFHGTDLAERLRGHGVTWLAVCGLTADCCVDATVRDGFQLGFRTVVAADATASYDRDRHAHTLDVLGRHAAVVATVKAMTEAWGSS
ncbi:cysteine hydrolase [Nocardiopsis exhalans]|uniref:Ureidoacrylate peracid hydrolase n=2 Tax=Nocardiopsis TaxID=2013 RepID=A0A840WFV7_9ACTN|nr:MULTISPECIES: isochorismatase family cysteine hydrolase [Nocardiopsis]MBB5494313.1 ureidoacrylate peracid hydrolase [Nocardiopsis metallicus]USY20634.1 cysteine hydrolase [Nocardiopsis exhalans]